MIFSGITLNLKLYVLQTLPIKASLFSLVILPRYLIMKFKSFAELTAASTIISDISIDSIRDIPDDCLMLKTSNFSSVTTVALSLLHNLNSTPVYIDRRTKSDWHKETGIWPSKDVEWFLDDATQEVVFPRFTHTCLYEIDEHMENLISSLKLDIYSKYDKENKILYVGG